MPIFSLSQKGPLPAKALPVSEIWRGKRPTLPHHKPMTTSHLHSDITRWLMTHDLWCYLHATLVDDNICIWIWLWLGNEYCVSAECGNVAKVSASVRHFKPITLITLNSFAQVYRTLPTLATLPLRKHPWRILNSKHRMVKHTHTHS
jgi:hypothetical protein